jgi:chemotaxis protein MotB
MLTILTHTCTSRATRLTRTLSLGLLATLPLTGCVGQDKYDSASDAARTQEARNMELLQDKQTAMTLAQRKQQRIDQLEQENRLLNEQVSLLSTQIQGFGGTLSSLQNEVSGFNLALLDPTADKALRDLRDKYPNLIQYDSTRGMLRFASDLTFDSGSDVVKSGGAEGLRTLAEVLNGAAAAYNIEVIGHTDNQPIGASRNRFPTNRHLSVARAISVGNALQSAGIAGSRMKVAGWGEYMPAVANNPTGGTAGNRRVEIFLIPAQNRAGAAPAASTPSSMRETAPAPQPAAPARDFPMK